MKPQIVKVEGYDDGEGVRVTARTSDGYQVDMIFVNKGSYLDSPSVVVDIGSIVTKTQNGVDSDVGYVQRTLEKISSDLETIKVNAKSVALAFKGELCQPLK